MKIKSKSFRLFIIKFISFFRKLYSPIFFYLIWIFYLKWSLKKEEIENAKSVWNDIYNSPTLKIYQNKLADYKWLSDGAKGAFDVTYEYIWLNFIERITLRYGRDCDDFAEMTFKWMQRVGYSEVYKILYTPEDLKKSHFVVMGKLNEDHEFIIKSNNSNVFYTKSLDYKEAIESYIEKDVVWTVYESFKNK